MKRRRSRVACAKNNRWYERYGKDGYFCIPRSLLFNLVDVIDNATFYAYVALASCHFEDNTTYAGPHVAKLTGKDQSAVRGYLADIETLGLITRESFGRGFKILFECPTRARIKQGAAVLEQKKCEALERRRWARASKAACAPQAPLSAPAPAPPPPPPLPRPRRKFDDDAPDIGDFSD